MPVICLNGQLLDAAAACLPVDNRAFRYGLGLFETMLMRHGHAGLWAYHMERLLDGMDRLGLPAGPLLSPAALWEQLMQTTSANGLNDRLCRVRLQVYGGSGPMHADLVESGLLIECTGLDADPAVFPERGLHIGVARGLAKSPDELANLKSSNALIYTQAARQARAQGWDDALIFNTSGNFIESSVCNLFWLQAGQICTPPLSEGCVAGVMRRHILERCRQAGMEVLEHACTPGLLQQAEEIWLTNALYPIRWAGQFEGRSLGNATALRVASLLQD